MGNVSFYCTRCRRLTKFPDVCRETIVRCPHCQQALIVPSIPADGEFVSKPSVSNAPVPPPYADELPSSDAQGYYAYNATDSGVLVHSHLSREKSRRIVPIAGAPSSQWSQNLFGEEPQAPSDFNSSVFHTPADVSDAEFMTRLREETFDVPSVEAPVPPPLASDYYESFDQKTTKEESHVESGRLQRVAILAAALSTVVLSVVIGVLAYRAGRLNAIDPTLAASEPIAVEGRVVYRDKSGRDEGDEGALLFFFPANRVFDKPLIPSGLSPQDADPSENEDFLTELSKAGGYFGTVGFDGYFSLEIAEPGDYRFLVVSKHVEDSVDSADKRTLGEISKYLFLPERKLLARNRFLWSTETINERSSAIEKNFGKSANKDL